MAEPKNFFRKDFIRGILLDVYDSFHTSSVITLLLVILVVKIRGVLIQAKRNGQNKSDKNWVANDVIGYLATYGYQLAIHLPYLLIADDKMQKENKKSCAGCILFILE